MILHINGLAFKAHSPSDLELISVRDDIDDPTASVRVRFNGYKWWIEYRSRNSNVNRMFSSRDVAIQLIADRAR